MGAFNMHKRFCRFVALFGLSMGLLARAQDAPQNDGDFSNNPEAKKLPTLTSTNTGVA
jgi:hypothetical protein